MATTGAFRTVYRNDDWWDVYFKHFQNGLMVQVAYNLSKEDANKLKDKMNHSLLGPREPWTPEKPEEVQTGSKDV